MQIRQSSLIKFGNILVRNMIAAGEQDPDMKYSLDYMHSRYKGKKVLTLISPETGGMVLLGQDDPNAPFTLLITASRVVPADATCWKTELQEMGIRQSQQFAQWLIDTFKVLSWMDTNEQFEAKLNQLFEDAKALDFKFGRYQYETFEQRLYDI
jgi:hypothetical protein